MDLNIGGVTLCDVIKFQTRILFGAQYGRIEYAKNNNNPDELILACLRVGWTNAFRHASENQKGVETAVREYMDCNDILDDEYSIKRGKIAHKTGRRIFDEYFCSVLLNSCAVDTYKKYASARSTDERCKIVQDSLAQLNTDFKKVKKEIRFGHIQKMFNIASKFYLCLYLCKDFLEIGDGLFCKEIVSSLETADCPVDSIIIDRLEQKAMEEKGVGEKHDLMYKDLKWSNLSTDNDIEAYKCLQKAFKAGNKSSLCFDFAEWN